MKQSNNERFGKLNLDSTQIMGFKKLSEPSTTIPQGSRAKWPEMVGTLKTGGDIVCSAWKHAAGIIPGHGITTHVEHQDFSTVVAAKRMTLKDLSGYNSSLLNISEEDLDLGYKHVFQTRPTKSTVGERIRSPMGLFDKNQTFMDNDCQILLDHLHKFYQSA